MADVICVICAILLYMESRTSSIQINNSYLAIMLYLCTYNQVIELISEVIKYWFQ